MALGHIGAKSTIDSLTEASAEARACNMWFEHAREGTLEDFAWNFARKRAAIPVSNEDPPDDWTFRYTFPADCIKAQLIFNPAGPNADPVPFEIESLSDDSGKCILTDMQDAILIYTRNVSNPAIFTPSFVNVLSWRVAYHIAFNLTGSMDIEKRAVQGYASAIQSAAAGNANESMQRVPREAESIRARE